MSAYPINLTIPISMVRYETKEDIREIKQEPLGIGLSHS